MSRRIDPAEVAREYRQDLRARIARLPKPLKLVGFLSTESTPSKTYAEYTRVGCEDVGIQFEIREVSKLKLEEAIDAANVDPNVHGIIVYYPIFSTDHDRYLKDLVDLRKDIEGLNSFWARKLYHNQRFVDVEKTRKAILPCTPLAVVKLLEAAGCMTKGSKEPLAGKKIVVFNRSEVVGRPLASMLANDGAQVFSFDLDGPLLFNKENVVETSATRAEALAQADIVITGVPSREFKLVDAPEIRPGTVCVNFSTLRNFTDAATAKAEIFIPRVGPMTVAMALRNTLRLYDNYHSQ